MSNHEELGKLEEILGEEAVNLLCDYLIDCSQVFTMFRYLHHEHLHPMTTSSMTSEYNGIMHYETYEAFGLSVLQCIRLFLVSALIDICIHNDLIMYLL